MSVLPAVDVSLLALAVVATAVGALHDTRRAPGAVVAVVAVVTVVGEGGAGLVGEDEEEDEDAGEGGQGGEEGGLVRAHGDVDVLSVG